MHILNGLLVISGDVHTSVPIHIQYAYKINILLQVYTIIIWMRVRVINNQYASVRIT